MVERKAARTEGEAVLRMLAMAGRSATVDPEARERFARQAEYLSKQMGVSWTTDHGFKGA